MRNERRAFGSSFFMLFFLLGDRTRNPFKLRNKLLVTTTIVVAVLRKMKTHSSSTTAFSQTYSMVSFPVFQRTYHCFAAVPSRSPWHAPAAPRGYVCTYVSTELLPLIGAFVCAAAPFLQTCNA